MTRALAIRLQDDTGKVCRWTIDRELPASGFKGGWRFSPTYHTKGLEFAEGLERHRDAERRKAKSGLPSRYTERSGRSTK